MPVEHIPPPGDFNIWTIAIGLGMAAWGGIVSYMHKAMRGIARCNLREFALELMTSCFAGLLAFIFALYMGVPVYVAGALSGIAGHAGTRTIFLFQSMAMRRARRALGGDDK